MSSDRDKNIVPSQKPELSRYSSDLIKRGLDLFNHVKHFEQPSSQAPERSAEALWQSASDKINRKDYQSAIEDLNQALQINPNYFNVYHSRGFARSHLEDEQGAIEDYNQALQINPNSAKTYNNRGMRRSDLGDYVGAIEDFNQALLIEPQLRQAYANLLPSR